MRQNKGASVGADAQNEQKEQFLWFYEIRAPVHNRPFIDTEKILLLMLKKS